jgi:hypothetical protein
VALCASLFLFPPLSRAAEYAISQISDEDIVSREPVINEEGVVAWYGSLREGGPRETTDIHVYRDGKTVNVTEGKRGVHRLSDVKPQISGDWVVWVGAFESVRDVDWRLREVPDRDATYPELYANYVHTGGDDEPEVWLGPFSNDMYYAQEATSAPPAGLTGTGAVSQAAQPAPTLVVTTNDAGQVVTNVVQPVVEPPPPPPKFPVTNPPPDVNYPTNLYARRHPSGHQEIMLWRGGGEIQRITMDGRYDLGPSVDHGLIAWQKAKGWPFGWEIMVYSQGERNQITTNFYYDMAPVVSSNQVAWYGWDGHDFEIFLYNHLDGSVKQITDNQYDDVGPSLWNGVIAWEAYPSADAEIYLWKEGRIRKISDNLEDDLNPRVWEDKVVWQGFDGDDFEIYYFDGQKTIKLTSNTYDDLSPDLRDGTICWIGHFENWDAEVFAWAGNSVVRLTDNDYEDRYARTAGGRIVWQADEDSKSIIYLAEPKK